MLMFISRESGLSIHRFHGFQASRHQLRRAKAHTIELEIPCGKSDLEIAVTTSFPPPIHTGANQPRW